MKNCTLFLFSSIFVSSIAFGQQQHATIVVLADSSAGETMYLKRFHAPGLNYDNIDSAKIVNGAVSFHLMPDPMKEYELYAGRNYIASDIYLVSGDSLVFSYGPEHRTLAFDRIGANEMLQDSSSRPQSQWAFYHDMEKRGKTTEGSDWDARCAYSNERVATMTASAARIMSKYPEHTGLASAMRGAEMRWYYEPRFRYYYKYFDDDTMSMDPIDVQRTSILNSISWNDPLFGSSDQMSDVANEWINIKGWYWRKAGIDTAGKLHQYQNFKFCLALPSPARDAAVLSAISGLKSLKPDTAVSLGEKELKEYRSFSPDSGYVRKFEEIMNVIRKKLPGKPAPNFELPDTAGILLSINNFRGKTIYLDFWGTWCEPCREELWDLKNLEKTFEKDTSIVFVSIGLEASRLKEQTVQEWKKFIADSSLCGVHLYADHQFMNDYVQAYGIQGVPTFMLIDRNGNFIDAASPRPSSGKAERAIRAALSEP